jgi:hypothetical protein
MSSKDKFNWRTTELDFPEPPIMHKNSKNDGVFDSSNSDVLKDLERTYKNVVEAVYEKIVSLNRSDDYLRQFDIVILSKVINLDNSMLKLLIEKSYQEYSKHIRNHWAVENGKLSCVSKYSRVDEDTVVSSQDLYENILPYFYYAIWAKVHFKDESYKSEDILPMSLDSMKMSMDLFVTMKLEENGLCNYEFFNPEIIFKEIPRNILKALYAYSDALYHQLGDFKVPNGCKRLLDDDLNKRYYETLGKLSLQLGDYLHKTNDGSSRVRG